MIQWMLAIWSLVPLPVLNPVCISESSWFTYCSSSWTLNFPGSYAILFFMAPDLTFTTRHIYKWVSFLLCPSHIILSGAISNCPLLFPSSILDTFQPGRRGGASSVVMTFCLFILLWDSCSKNTTVVCHSLLQWTTFCQNSSQWPVRLGWPCMAWLIASPSNSSPFARRRLQSMKGPVNVFLKQVFTTALQPGRCPGGKGAVSIVGGLHFILRQPVSSYPWVPTTVSEMGKMLVATECSEGPRPGGGSWSLHSMVDKAPDSWGRTLAFCFWFWTSCFTSLCLRFPICKVRMITISRMFSRSCHED